MAILMRACTTGFIIGIVQLHSLKVTFCLNAGTQCQYHAWTEEGNDDLKLEVGAVSVSSVASRGDIVIS